MSKGTVRVEVFRDRLRLAWSWHGKRFWLYIGLPETNINRKAAEIKARQIELDMISNNFDETLAKYKPQKQETIVVTELFVGVSRGEAIAFVPTNSAIYTLRLLPNILDFRNMCLSFSEPNLFLVFRKHWRKSFEIG